MRRSKLVAAVFVYYVLVALILRSVPSAEPRDEWIWSLIVAVAIALPPAIYIGYNKSL